MGRVHAWELDDQALVVGLGGDDEGEELLDEEGLDGGDGLLLGVVHLEQVDEGIRLGDDSRFG